MEPRLPEALPLPPAMPADLKSFFSPGLVRRLAADLARAHPSFPERAFVRDACAGLEALELLDRGLHIAGALAKHLPPAYPEAIEVLLRSLGPEHATDELLGAGMAPFFYLPHVLFVTERGLDHFDLSMRTQYELTKRFSAESSMRPFIARDPERTFAVLGRWAGDGNAHVRRLVSECTRLRLPWAPRVAWLDAPTPSAWSSCSSGSRTIPRRRFAAASRTTSTTSARRIPSCGRGSAPRGSRARARSPAGRRGDRSAS